MKKIIKWFNDILTMMLAGGWRTKYKKDKD